MKAPSGCAEQRLAPRLEVPGFQRGVCLSREEAPGLEPAAEPHRARRLLAVVEAAIAVGEASLPQVEIDVVAAETGDVVEAAGVHDRAAGEMPEARLLRGPCAVCLSDHRLLPISPAGGSVVEAEL